MSRVASAASSSQGGGGRLLLDAGSLAVLGSHFERLMGAIQGRVDDVRIISPTAFDPVAVPWTCYLNSLCYIQHGGHFSSVTRPQNLHF